MKSKNTSKNNTKSKIRITKMLITSIIIFIMLLLESTMFLNMQTKAATNSIISDDYYEVDENEKVISRIEPETDITTFKNKLIKRNSTITTENLKIYKEKECINEVTEGLVGTSMFLKIEANSSDNIYELSVVGDIDGDGKSNQISLAKIIRYIVGTSNEKLEGIEYKSADLTGDGTVDQRDITKIIRYIVFGELDLGKINQIPYATENGAIIFGDTVWNDQKNMAEVEISTQIKMRNNNNRETGQTYIVEYQVNGTNGTWTRGYKRESVTVTGLKAGDILYARLTDGTNVGSFIYKKIEPPEPEVKTTNLNVQTKSKTTTEIQVEAEPEEPDVLKNDAVYTFYIKEQGADDSEYIQVQQTTSKTCNFTNLKAGTKYTIKVEAKDSIGNNATKIVTEDTKSLPGGDQAGEIDFENLTWIQNNGVGKAQVTISTNTQYQIEYQIVPDGSVIGATAWQKGTVPNGDTKSIATATNIDNNSTIYARLIDGQSSSNYKTLKVTDINAPTLNTSSTSTTSEITSTVTAVDNETGLGQNPKYEFYIKANSNSGKINSVGTDYSVTPTYTGTNAKYTFTGLKAGETYTIKIEVTDLAGNKAVKEQTATTETIPDTTTVQGAISFSAVTWKQTNGVGKASVAIGTIETGYYIECQVVADGQALNANNWTKGQSKGEAVTLNNLNNNDTVYARLTDGINSGSYATLKVTDLNNPTLNASLTSTTSEITSTVTAVDNETGLGQNPEYKFYIKANSNSGKTNNIGTDYSTTPTYTGTNATYTFTGLKAGETYTIKIEVTDLAGNKAVKEQTATTETIPDTTTVQGAISFSAVTWTQNSGTGKASVTVSTTETDYYIEYQVVADGQTLNATSWTKGQSKGEAVTLNNLNNKDTVYARLTDGTNSGNYATLKVIDAIKPVLDLNLTAGQEKITAVALAKDLESGIPENATYKFYMKETGSPDTSYEEKQNTTDKTLTIPNLTVGKNYTIKLEVQDKAGNIGIVEKSILIPDDIAPVVDFTVTEKTTSTAKVKATSTDVGGLPTPTIYVFYIKETGADDSTYKKVQESDNDTCEFTGLQQGKDYTVKVTVDDEAHNTGIKERSILTEKVPDTTTVDGAIVFSTLTWKQTNGVGTASVTVSTTETDYYIEYQAVADGQVLNDSSWTKAQNKGDSVIINNLNNNDTAYARLTDGTNSGNYATLKVIDAIKPVLDLNLTAGQEKITAVALAKDLESGIPENATYKFYMKETGSPDTSYEEKQNTTDKTLTIPNLTVGKNYTIKLEVQDKAGNIGIVEKSILIPDDIAPVVDFTVTEKTTSTAKVKATSTDVGGLPTPTIYVFYIKETGADDSTYKKVQESDNDTCEFTGLQQGKDYTVKVTVDDEAHNTGIKERSILTEKVPDTTTVDGAIVFSTLTWKQTNGVGTASVTVSTTETDYYIEYQAVADGQVLNSSSWTKGQNKGETVTLNNLNNNDTVYARLTDGTNSGNYATLKVADLNAPTVNVSLTSTTSEITSTVTAVDNETGLGQNPKYEFYIKANSNSGKINSVGTDYSVTPTYTGTNAKYTFTGLKAGETYTIKIEVTDLAGNKAVKEQTVTTEAIPDTTTVDGAIAFSAVTWTQNNGVGTASVTVSTTETDYYIEYQVVEDGQVLNSSSWTKGKNKGETVTLNNLNNNDTVYARLTDGINSGNYATLKVTDLNNPTLNASLTSTTSEITSTVTAVDNETGLGQNPEYKFYIKANSNSGKTNNIVTDYSITPTYAGTNATYTFTGLKAGQAYTVKVEVTDLAGNKAVKEQTVTTETIPDTTTVQGAISFSAVTWTQNSGTGKASVTVSTTETDYYIEYQVVADGQTLNANNWTKGQNKGKTVTLNNLNNKDTVYARLTDGTNSGNYATLLVADTIKPENFTIEVSNVKINGFTVKGQTVDNQTGIKSYTIVANTGNSTTTKRIENITTTSYDVTDLTPGTDYTVYMIAIDNAGNEMASNKVTLTTKALEIVYETVAVNTTNNATTSAPADSITKGKTLYINIVAKLEGQACTVTLKEDSTKTAPYAVTKNGKYTFTVKGTYNGKTITGEKEVTVNQFKVLTGVVKYDAGTWTQAEINALGNLYNENSSHEASSSLTQTFGGFKAGDSRNDSVQCQTGTPAYSGWEILTSEVKNGKTYVTKIVHAGAPENYVYYNTDSDDGYRSEWILSGGTRQTGYSVSGKSPRKWDMYIDKSQKSLISEVHAMTYDEAYAITGSRDYTDDARRYTGEFYWLASAHKYSHSIGTSLKGVDNSGDIISNSNYCLGVRPVVSLQSGVYISGGSGTEEDPYILAKE